MMGCQTETLPVARSLLHRNKWRARRAYESLQQHMQTIKVNDSDGVKVCLQLNLLDLIVPLLAVRFFPSRKWGPLEQEKKSITRKQNREKETHFLFSFFVHLPSKSEKNPSHCFRNKSQLVHIVRDHGYLVNIVDIFVSSVFKYAAYWMRNKCTSLNAHVSFLYFSVWLDRTIKTVCVCVCPSFWWAICV